MYKKFKDKLHIGSPGSGRRSPSPNARNAGDGSTRWETLLNATQTTLAIAKESVAGLPVPGLEAAIGGLLKVLTIYQGMKSNEEAIKSFNEAVVRLNDNVAAPLKAAIASQLDFVDDDLQKRLELLVKDLTDLTKRTETMSSREQRRKFSSTQDDLGIIQELNRELDRIVMAFIGRGSISAEMEARAGKRMAQTLVIDKLPRAQARHDSASRVGANPCFQGTRNGILKEISAWIDDPNTRPIFWLSGMAGIGKSTIAQTIAEQEEKKHRLAASFFFSRDEADRRNSHLVYPTIALQLAGFDGSLREPIAQALERDADIGHAIMQKQFENLIAGPLVKLKARATTLLFVLDALDECSSADGAREILTRWALELPRISTQVGVALKVLITSRPELHIHDEFNHPSLRLISQSFVLHDIERSVVQADIELFLTQRLVGLAARHGVGIPWPTVAEVNALVSRSDNLFIFASTTVNFIGGVKSGRSLQHRLDRLLKPDPNHTTSAFAQLDALYHRVLEDAENDLEETIPNSKETFRSVLEAVVLILDPLPSTSLAALLSLQHDDVLTTVQDLRSILVIPAASESSEPIRFFHPSFYDFITTPGRQSGRFLITSSEGHARLAKLCLETMHSLLEKDPCSLGSPWVLHSDVADLQVRLDMAAPTHLRYSCRFFGSHISLSPRGDEALGHLLDVFCESKLLMWLEMMSLLGDIDGAIHSIQLLKSWCHNNPGVQKLTIDLVHDAYRVLLQFQSPLRLSSGHLYTTALSFIPACSLTRPYGSQRRANYVVRGKPAQWDANLITADAQSQLSTLAYFPDGKRIVTGGREGLITVWNSSTGAEISSLGEPEEGVGELDVSGDGARIAAWESDARKFSIGIWDTATGGLVSRLKISNTTSDTDHRPRFNFARFIANGLELLTVSEPSTLRRWNSDTGQILSTHKLDIDKPKGMAVSRCGSVVAVQDKDFLKIWELRADDTMSLMQAFSKGHDLESLHRCQVFILDNWRVLSLLCRSAYASATLWDYRNGVELKAIKIPCFWKVAVCDEGKRMAFATIESDSLQVWDIESGSMLGQLVPNTYITNLVFSPTEMVLASTSHDATLRTWDISEIISGSSSATPGVEKHDWIGLSADRQGAGAIMTCQATKAVRVWNISEPNYSTLDVPDISCSSVMSLDGSYFACQTSGPIESAGWVVYETASLQPLQTLPTRITGTHFNTAVFSGDGRLIAICAVAEMPVNASTVKVWDIHQSQMLYEGTLSVLAVGVAFLLNGTSLLVVHDAGHLVLDLSSSGDDVGMVEWRVPRRSAFEARVVGGVAPDGVHFFLIWTIALSIHFHLVNMKDPSQQTKYEEGSFVFQMIETGSGYEPVFLECDPMGNLYKRGGNSTKLLCWLPPSWRFSKDQHSNAVWRGSYLIVGLRNGEIGVIDIDALSE